MVPERVLYESGAVAIELILYRLQYLSPGCNGIVHNGVHIVDVKKDANRGTAARLRSQVSHVGELVGQHNRRISNLDFGVPDPAIGLRHAHKLGGSEGLFVKLDSISRTLYDQVGCRSMVARWYGIDRRACLLLCVGECHVIPP